MASPRSLAHHVRFARTLALLTGLGAGAAGCYGSHVVGADSGPVDTAAPDSAFADAALRDTGHDAAATCETCTCSFGTPPPSGSCEAAGLWMCCAAIALKPHRSANAPDSRFATGRAPSG